MTRKFYWAGVTEVAVDSTGSGIKPDGFNYGYSVNSINLKDHVSESIKLAESPRDCSDIVFIGAPCVWKLFSQKYPSFGYINRWLYTTFEAYGIADAFLKQLRCADFFMVPSTWNREILLKYFDKSRVFLVPHGVDPVFSFCRRKKIIGRPFRFLYNGVLTPRKGVDVIRNTWDKYFKDYNNFELYIKTTGIGSVGLKRDGNVIIDGRNLKKQELLKVYHAANAFIFPTEGEGFSLVLAEAMRTGLPCIATNFSGHMDFFDNTVGYPLDFKMVDRKIDKTYMNGAYTIQVARVANQTLADMMYEVFENYDEAIARGERGSQRISVDFTWQRSAKHFVDAVKSVC